MLWTCIFVGIHLNLFSRQIYPIWKKGKTINKNKSNQFKSNSSTTNTIFLHKFRIRMSHCRIPATEKSHLHKKPSLKHLNFLWFLTHWIWYKDWVKVICHVLFFIWTKALDHCDISRNFLETRETIKIKSHPFYPKICDWFLWQWSKKKNQNGLHKKTEIFNSPNSQYFFSKISWIGHWVSRID